MKQHHFAFALAGAMLVAACSGGGTSPGTSLPAPPASGSPVPTAGPLSGTRGAISIVIPLSPTVAAGARRSQFVSSAAMSAVVILNSGSPASYDVSATSTLCVTAVSRSCTIPIGVPFGTTTATASLNLYNGVAGTGTLLGTGTGSTPIASNATSFNIAIQVQPIVASVAFSLSFPSTGLPRISINHAETGTATLTFTDAGGAIIPNTDTSPFVTPINLSVVDPSGTVSILPATITNAAQAVTVSYTGGPAIGANVTFNAVAGATLGTLVSKTSGYQTTYALGLRAGFSKDPNEITVGSDGVLWFTEFNNNALGRMDPANPAAYTELPVPNVGNSPQPSAIAAGPAGDAHVWYTEPTSGQSGSIGKFGNEAVPSGAASVLFSTGGAFNNAVGIRSLGNNVWMSIMSTSQLLISDTTGTQVPFSPVALPGATGPFGLAVGPDGNMWVAGFNNGTILAYSGTSPFTQIANKPVPAGAGSHPAELVTGPDGALWFTEQIAGNIGRIPFAGGVSGAITEFPLTAPITAPWAITAGSDGGVWFAASEAGFSDIVRIDPTTKTFVSYRINSATTQASYGLVTGPDGNLWMTDFNASSIVRIQP